MKLTFDRLVISLTFIAIFAMAARVSTDSDTWWHLRAGQWIVEHRAVPMADLFSHTRANAAWQYPGWLAEVLMASPRCSIASSAESWLVLLSTSEQSSIGQGPLRASLSIAEAGSMTALLLT